MVTIYDVPADALTRKASEYLAENADKVRPPAWAPFAKTGAHTQRLPDNENWWYIRCASLLRKIYLTGPVGVSRLRLEYGGKKSGKKRPEHFRRGSGSILRKALQQLEESGLVKTVPKKGRILTDKGKSILDMLANEIKKEMAGRV